jgi:hypothetical protein
MLMKRTRWISIIPYQTIPPAPLTNMQHQHTPFTLQTSIWHWHYLSLPTLLHQTAPPAPPNKRKGPTNTPSNHSAYLPTHSHHKRYGIRDSPTTLTLIAGVHLIISSLVLLISMHTKHYSLVQHYTLCNFDLLSLSHLPD